MVKLVVRLGEVDKYTPEVETSQERLKRGLLRAKMATSMARAHWSLYFESQVRWFQVLLRKWLRPESLLLLLRTLGAARVVRGALAGCGIDPNLAPAIRAVESVYLPPQAGWRISDPRLIASAAIVMTTLPRRWGRCVQQSLITYRLLNGYGIPAKVCYGVSIANPDQSGHAWIRAVNPSDQELVGSREPLDHFRVVFVSAVPLTGAAVDRRRNLPDGPSEEVHPPMTPSPADKDRPEAEELNLQRSLKGSENNLPTYL